MKIVTSEQMRSLDRAAIERHGIPSLVLMERAGLGLARLAASLSPGKERPIAVIAGPGNNGGDGLVAARHLLQSGHAVFVVLLAEPAKLGPDARANYDRLLAMSAEIQTAQTPAELEGLASRIAEAGAIVDAIFGTGLVRDVGGVALRAIDLLNSLGIPIAAADIPSGLDANTGFPKGAAVCARATAAFGLPKRGLYVGDGPRHAGKVEVIDIGLPAAEVASLATPFELIEPAMFARHFPRRDPASHKGDYGHALIVAGSGGHLGAGYLASLAALRAGCGLVTLALPQAAFERFDARYPEIMCDPIPDGGSGHFTEASLPGLSAIARGKDAAALGPAIGTAAETRAFVNAFAAASELPLVLDADALNVLDVEGCGHRRQPTILTPHPGEMGRLLGIASSEVQADRLGAAIQLAAKSSAIVVLKGQGTIVATPAGGVAFNPTGNPGMATAGMGDLLTGIIASFLAQGIDAAAACHAAVYCHGLAGDLAAASRGEASLIATDVIEKLGEAMKAVRSSDRSLVRS